MIETSRKRKFLNARVTDVDLIQLAIEKASGENGLVGELFKHGALKAPSDLSSQKTL